MSEDSSPPLPEWAKKFVSRDKLRWNGKRWTLPVGAIPIFPEFKDCMPRVEHDGIRKNWVGIGWVDEGPAHGDELLLTEG